ncbi:storage protein [Nannochloropsis oceanica]
MAAPPRNRWHGPRVDKIRGARHITFPVAFAMIILVALHTFPKFYSEISNAPSQELVRDLNEAPLPAETFTEAQLQKEISKAYELGRQAGGRRKPGECVGPRGSVWSERGFNYYLFRDMFYPYEKGQSEFKSLVLFTAGRSAMANIDGLVRLWGLDNFDYVLMHFDDSATEWNQFDWYKHTVGITAQNQAKFWFYKRFASPWLVSGYRYIHFVDSDAGSPPDRPFNLTTYENFLSDRDLLIAQPAITKVGRSSDHKVCQVHNHTLYRTTSVVENGPFYSVSQQAYACYWEMIDSNAVSGWGPDVCWCQYLHEVCGFPLESACSIIDAFPLDHLDKKTASAHKFRGKDYWQYGFEEWASYEKRMKELLVSKFQKTAGYFKTLKEWPLEGGVGRMGAEEREERRRRWEEERVKEDARILK